MLLKKQFVIIFMLCFFMKTSFSIQLPSLKDNFVVFEQISLKRINNKINFYSKLFKKEKTKRICFYSLLACGVIGYVGWSYKDKIFSFKKTLDIETDKSQSDKSLTKEEVKDRTEILNLRMLEKLAKENKSPLVKILKDILSNAMFLGLFFGITELVNKQIKVMSNFSWSGFLSFLKNNNYSYFLFSKKKLVFYLNKYSDLFLNIVSNEKFLFEKDLDLIVVHNELLYFLESFIAIVHVESNFKHKYKTLKYIKLDYFLINSFSNLTKKIEVFFNQYVKNHKYYFNKNFLAEYKIFVGQLLNYVQSNEKFLYGI